MGIVVAYDASRGKPVWRDEFRDPFLYVYFGSHGHDISRVPRDELVLRMSPRSIDAWSINDRLFPAVHELALRPNASYVLRFRYASMMEHPMHAHGHSFELVGVDDLSIARIIKDTVVVRPGGTIDVLLRANKPYRGRYLLHCHNDEHVQGGTATVLAYQSELRRRQD